jgi:hypothetical protein
MVFIRGRTNVLDSLKKVNIQVGIPTFCVLFQQHKRLELGFASLDFACWFRKQLLMSSQYLFPDPLFRGRGVGSMFALPGRKHWAADWR